MFINSFYLFNWIFILNDIIYKQYCSSFFHVLDIQALSLGWQHRDLCWTWNRQMSLTKTECSTHSSLFVVLLKVNAMSSNQSKTTLPFSLTQLLRKTSRNDLASIGTQKFDRSILEWGFSISLSVSFEFFSSYPSSSFYLIQSIMQYLIIEKYI